MDYSTQHQQIALTLLSGIGSKRARIIVSYFNDLEEFFSDKKLNISKLPGITETMISWKQRKAVLDQADEIIEQTAKLGGEIMFFTDSNYPKKLRQCEDAPLVLYSKGNLNWNTRRSVAVVGTRKMTHYGRELTEELIEGLKNMDVVVVSGMAYGVDVCAHKQALRNNLETWGVLGHGLDKLYPGEHRKVSQEMIERGGLISEFIPGMDIEPGNFPMRNRIVAGLTDATIVVESGISGGSMITANLARDYHREVFAFPGDVKKESSAGCLKLIRDNTASLIQSSADFLESMDWEPAKETLAQTRLFLNLGPEEERVVHCLQEKKELSIDILGILARLPVHELSSLLLELEFKGLIRSLPGKRYSLV